MRKWIVKNIDPDLGASDREVFTDEAEARAYWNEMKDELFNHHKEKAEREAHEKLQEQISYGVQFHEIEESEEE